MGDHRHCKSSPLSSARAPERDVALRKPVPKLRGPGLEGRAAGLEGAPQLTLVSSAGKVLQIAERRGVRACFGLCIFASLPDIKRKHIKLELLSSKVLLTLCEKYTRAALCIPPRSKHLAGSAAAKRGGFLFALLALLRSGLGGGGSSLGWQLFHACHWRRASCASDNEAARRLNQVRHGMGVQRL